MKKDFIDLTTEFEKEKSITWQSEHPDPQFRRENWLSLCGEWSLSVMNKGVEELGNIIVPFPPESRISGIKRPLKPNERYIYQRSFILPESFYGKRVILHFEAVDQIAEVYLNEKHIGTHIGGYTPFSFDITDSISQNNHLKVVVADKLDKTLPYGKQRKKRGGMWYTPISGIWQAVWLEAVPDNYISHLRLTSTLSSVTIETLGGNSTKTVMIDGIGEYTYSGDRFTLNIESAKLWTPDEPNLYNFTITAGDDKVHSYFALRTIEIKEKKLCLNTEPIYYHGLLDQGYFPDGIYTPASPVAYIKDIMTSKELGFNMLRKHIKLEPKLFYYYCDKLGITVFQDMINNRSYSFLLDTALPTIGIKRGLSRPATKRCKKHFETTSREIITTLYNHPSVVYYTIFNEGWGQYEPDRLYRELKALDPTRIYDTTSGWFFSKKSDVQSEHVYFKKADLKPHPTRPLVLSEFGGYSCKIKKHSFNLSKTYGYRKIETQAEFTSALDALYHEEIIPLIKKGLCASVLTQISDVEDETNGLMTYDRRVIKPDISVMKRISEDINNTFKQTNE
ncbi:MAG: glycoside hydrolase family 2 [Ruminococcaceae bacterium]|nr:glycoside hydrolase family 2 [Oscillospiraceae bacterium]